MRPVVHVIAHANGVLRAVVTLPAMIDALPALDQERMIENACVEARDRLTAVARGIEGLEVRELPASLREAIPDIGSSPVAFVRAAASQ